MADFNSDPVLIPLLEEGPDKRKTYLAELISTHAEPVIKKVIYSRLSISPDRKDTKESWDAADLCGNAMMQLLSHLSKFSDNPEEHPIRDFRSYTAVVAHHACNQHFREKYPKRTQLSNKLRYLLNHNPDFALWIVDNQAVCGLHIWKNNSPVTRIAESSNPLSQLREKLKGDPDPSKLSRLLTSLFQIVKHPLFFDDLLTLMIDMLGIREQRRAEEPKGENENIVEQLEDHRVNTAAKIEHRLYLKKLWSEMLALPLRQRTALLLSMRDPEGSSVLYLFPLTRITSIAAIAECLKISAEDFAHLWDKLPLEDHDIASLLGLKRQQVINLRRSARERLARRMGHY